MAKLFYAVVLGLLAGVIVHICVLLLVPYYARYNTLSQLQRSGPLYRFQNPGRDNPAVKTSDPLFRLEICAFSLANSPVHVTATGQVPFWSLSIYNDTGINLYSLNSRTAPNGMLDMVVSTPIQMIDFRQALPEAYLNSVLTAQNANNGFFILRVLKPSADWDRQVEAFLASASCKQIGY